MSKAIDKSFKKDKSIRFETRELKGSPRLHYSVGRSNQNYDSFNLSKVKKPKSQHGGKKRMSTLYKAMSRKEVESPTHKNKNKLISKIYHQIKEARFNRNDLQSFANNQIKTHSGYKRPQTSKKIAEKMRYYYSPYSNKLNCGSYMVFDDKSDEKGLKPAGFKALNDSLQGNAVEKWKLVSQFIDTLTPEYYQAGNISCEEHSLSSNKKKHKAKKRNENRRFTKINSLRKNHYKSSSKALLDKPNVSVTAIKKNNSHFFERINSEDLNFRTINRNNNFFNLEDESSMNLIKEETPYVHKSDKTLKLPERPRNSTPAIKTDSTLSRCNRKSSEAFENPPRTHV
ncbi:unnamed protein product [Moneuplotes crassus]|uniref:Uncharacterized protein n=1 Tax=Euplotes crassus TaxID=5936 RepID=A0AAD1TZU4_EUPCR|nr:unnamed protein product [Moneuplotes crassus]